MSIGEFRLVLLREDTEIMPFKCSDEDLNDFLFSDAKKYRRQMLAVTYLIEDERAGKTVAYFSLLNDMLRSDPNSCVSWNNVSRRIDNPKRRKQYPAIKIGRLAVSEEYAGKGVGKDILNIVKSMAAYGSLSACRFLTVDAYRDAVGFYEKMGFRLFLSKEGSPTCSMYYDLMDFMEKGK
ncbi:MAG: GNAT family N-acetyltransferase [Prevotella sp.]|nr:GNAT family N-acetyltransferase [Prevotella sp.]